jgi:hypothetical protein
MLANGTDRLAAAPRRRHEETLARTRTALRRFEATGERDLRQGRRNREGQPGLALQPA